MTVLIRPALLSCLGLACLLPAQDVVTRARRMESSGDRFGARSALQQAAANDASVAGLAYAEFLDRHRDPGAREAYERSLGRVSDGGQRSRILRRLVLLDLLNDDRASAARHLQAYRQAGGAPLSLPAMDAAQKPAAMAAISIPGPLRSFARMAALSPDLVPADLLTALARNVVTNGYQAGSNNEGLEQTEYMKLIVRYLGQARELEKVAGASKVLQVPSCDSTETGELLRVLGYRMRGGCGAEVVLETVNATRAFLTIDSGFPLAELEEALRTNRPFRYDYSPTQVPVLYEAAYWLPPAEKREGDFIDGFLGDPSLCRLYLGLSKMDEETAAELRKALPVARVRAFSHIFDFYGGMFQIRNGKAVVPGGAVGARTWGEMLGVSPDQGAQFFEKLVSRDDGWLASYYDAMARMNGPVRAYLLDSQRMKRYYNAIRGKITSPGPARPVFRANTDMMLLTTRLRLEPNGQPHIPGSLDVWKNLFVNHPHGKYDGKLTKAATGWKEPDDLIEALFALSRKAVDNEPLKIYMALSDLNRNRQRPLEAATVDRLARAYRAYGSQFPVLAEAPALTDRTILQFLDVAELVQNMKDQEMRADTAGTLQALVALWQILCRQESIAPTGADATLAAILTDFAKVRNERDLFDAGRGGVRTLLSSAKVAEDNKPQDHMVDLLAGATIFNDEDSHRTLIEDMLRLFEAQRLVSLTTLFELADHLDSVATGGKADPALLRRLSARITEIPLPRAALTAVEKNALSFGYWSEKHVEGQRKLNLRSTLEKAQGDANKLREIRGQLAPFLRDTLVGLAYIHYAPPGAQVLLTNPLFVRSHDFLGSQGTSLTWRPTEVLGSGWPSSAGGRLVGSLANLPYALAEAEQNFLIPSREQALIWGDLVPQMILSAKVPRWWNVTPDQMHWVGLHLRLGESLLAEAALDPARRQQVLAIYDRHAPPARVTQLDQALAQGRIREALEQVMPSELFVVAAEAVKAGDLKEDGSHTVLAAEIRRLAAESPDSINHRSISRAFGVPHPTLANSYGPELLHLRTFPTLMGYSSRIMAESWESSLLYYAALADEVHISPSQLNVYVPQWTQATVEKIFATHLEDWPALLRSLRLVGEEVRASGRKQMAMR